MKQRIQHDALPEIVLQSLANRDAALWIGPGLDSNEMDLDLLRRLIELPWQIVLCESTSSSLAKSLEDATESANRLSRQRGFVHLVASDPEDLELPPRALPVFFLNGRDDAGGREDSSQRTSRAMQRRRLNMISRLENAAPRLLFVLSSGGERPLDDVFELWQDGFRALLVVQSPHSTDAGRLDEWLKTSASAPTIDHCTAPFQSSVAALVERASTLLPEDRFVIRINCEGGNQRDIDITECELVEQPVFDRYEVVLARDLPHLEPDELSVDELNSFFDRSAASWRPFAAGLPWQRNHDANRDLLKILRRVEAAGVDENCVRIIASEPGAGGTTRAKDLALLAARAGFPTLLARPLKFQPKSTELEAFLYRVRQRVLAATAPSALAPSSDNVSPQVDALIQEAPWLLVFDVQHWDGRPRDLPALCKALRRSGRPVVLLAVTRSDIGDELQSDPDTAVIESLRHELVEADVLALGAHLNRFLKPIGKGKSESQWRFFWEKHRPFDMATDVASFWIALEFWLKGQFDLSTSIQEWIAAQFKAADLTDDARNMLLEIAALSIERQPYPEALLPPSPDGEFPYSVVLTDVRADVPALALVCDGAPPNRQWAMAHDLIGRYLVKAVYFDRALLSHLGLDAADHIQLRLLLLRRIATRDELARRLFMPLAVEFAVNILKLGTDGNLEFARYWKEVLGILEAMPRTIWDTNRTFNHHVAVSRRRVATSEELFQTTIDERFEQLSKAIEHLEYALNRLAQTDADDESDLNLLNSLSLAYQNLADVECERGASEQRLQELRTKATESARRAQQENPTNSYVLETFARNLLQNGRLYPQQASVCAAEALGYIYQAMALDRSLLREGRLTRLANDALAMLRSPDSSAQLTQVCANGNPLGFLGKAWLVLAEGTELVTKEDLTHLSAAKIDAALAVIDQAPSRANALLLRFRYDLLTVRHPYDFEEQLNLLDELEGIGSAIPLQLQLEHAILLHQQNRHPPANIEFRHIRDQLRTRDVFVDVPPRLRWLRLKNGKQRLCNARVIETRDRRSQAKVKELDNAIVPFIPQEFGIDRMPTSMSFKCAINFGAMGPFIKPPAREENEK